MQENNSQARVSVIIPAYNRQFCIENAIQSVLAQTYDDYEIIVVDDGSTDGTADLVTKKYPKIQLLRLPHNQGAAAARNAGIKAARGDLIAFLDSDDVWLPDYLKTQRAALAQNQNAVFAFCGCYIMENKRMQFVWPYNVRFLQGDLVEYALKNSLMPTLSIVVARKSALLRAGLFNESLTMCEDRELYLRLLLLGDLIYVPHVLAKKFISPNSLMNDYREWRKNSFRLLDIFFNSADGKRYKKLETKARKIWVFKTSGFCRYLRYLIPLLMKLSLRRK